MANDYATGKFKALEFEEYLEIIHDCVEIIPDNVVIHRLTGDGAKRLNCSALERRQKRVLNAISKL